jgi:hypothetical protein
VIQLNFRDKFYKLCKINPILADLAVTRRILILTIKILPTIMGKRHVMKLKFVTRHFFTYKIKSLAGDLVQTSALEE